MLVNCEACGCFNVVNAIHEISVDHTAVLCPALKEDYPLNVGKIVTFEKAGFTVVGHVRIVHNNYISNNWLLNFDNGNNYWFLEESFNYSLMEFNYATLSAKQVKVTGRSAGDEITVNGIKYSIIAFYKTVAITLNGQVPNYHPLLITAFSVDLHQKGQSLAKLYIDKNDRLFYIKAKKINLSELNLGNIIPV